MTIPQAAPLLRPLTIGQILDRTLRLYRANFVTFTGIIALMLIPVSIIQTVVTVLNVPAQLEAASNLNNPANSDNPMQLFADSLSASSGGGATFIVNILTFVLVRGVATAALVWAVSDSVLGQPSNILGSYSRVKGVWFKLLVTLILAGIITIGLFIWTLIPCVGWLTGFGIIVFFSGVLVPLLPPILVLETRSGWQTIRRAWDLARRRFWWVLGFMLIMGIFSYVVVVIPTLLISFLIQGGLANLLGTQNPTTILTIQTIAQQVSTLALTLLYTPVQLTATILLYFDLRVRTEGFDLAVQAASSGEGEIDSKMVAADAPPTERTSLVTMREMLYFAGITVGLFGLYVLCVGVVAALTIFTQGLAQGL